MDIERAFAKLAEVKPLKIATSREITVAVMGAGSRGNEYPAYGKLFEWGVPRERRFGDYHEMLDAGKSGTLADVMLVALPDDLHFEPAMEAMRQGYDVLLEKPMAQTERECLDLLARQRETGVMVAVGHVLRYSPYFRALKKAIDLGLVGELVNIQHQEPVMYAHMAHSFVRGNWHDSKATTPMIVAKCCHDLDILKWLVGKRCVRVSAEGGIALFRADKAPAGAPARCTGGCPHEKTCPYSAIDIYDRKRFFLYVFDLKKDCPSEAILEKLRTTDYGRCVYRMDNDQPDHIVASFRGRGDGELYDGRVHALGRAAHAHHGNARIYRGRRQDLYAPPLRHGEVLFVVVCPAGRGGLQGKRPRGRRPRAHTRLPPGRRHARLLAPFVQLGGERRKPCHGLCLRAQPPRARRSAGFYGIMSEHL